MGEYLLHFHPGANHEIERYLEKNGMEIIEARMTDICNLAAVWMSAEPRGRKRNREKAQGNVPGCADTSTGLRSGCQLCKSGEPSADVDYECKRAADLTK